MGDVADVHVFVDGSLEEMAAAVGIDACAVRAVNPPVRLPGTGTEQEGTGASRMRHAAMLQYRSKAVTHRFALSDEASPAGAVSAAAPPSVGDHPASGGGGGGVGDDGSAVDDVDGGGAAAAGLGEEARRDSFASVVARVSRKVFSAHAMSVVGSRDFLHFEDHAVAAAAMAPPDDDNRRVDVAAASASGVQSSGDRSGAQVVV